MKPLPFINLQAQRDLNSLVKNDETRRVNRDRTTTIDKDETITVHGQRTETVDKDETITIHQNRTEVVDKDESITIHQNRQERVDDNETIDIGGNRTETVHKSEQILIKGNRDKTVKGNDTLNVKKDRKENIDKSRSLTVDRTNTEFVKLGKSVTVGLGYATQVGTIMNTAVGIMQTEQIGRIKKSFVGKSYSITAGDEFKITVGKSSLVMNADGSIIITGTSIITQAEKENKVIGKDVLINPPGASAGGGKPEPDYLDDEPPEIGHDGLPILGSDDDAWYKKDTLQGKFNALMGEVWGNIKSSPDIITESDTVKNIQNLPSESIQAAKDGLMTSALLYPHVFGFDPDFVAATGGVGNGKQGGSYTSAVNIHNGSGYDSLNYDLNPNQISPSKFSVDGSVVYGFVLDKPTGRERNRANMTDRSLAGSSLAGTVCKAGICGSIVKTKADPIQGVPSRNILMVGLGQSLGNKSTATNSSGGSLSGSVMKPSEYNSYKNIEEIKKQVEKIKPYRE